MRGRSSIGSMCRRQMPSRPSVVVMVRSLARARRVPGPVPVSCGDAMTSAAHTEDDFRKLVEPHRAELHAHCYRMLGSVQDAEDALQEALLRAWRGLGRFEGRSSLRAWLYRIATNAALDVIARRPRRVLPADLGPATDASDERPPLAESVWIEAYPDALLADGLAAPDARYERRESVEIAFIAAVQHLPATQRAVL